MKTATLSGETEYAAAPPDAAADSVPPGAGCHVIDTRFGSMEFAREQALFMPRGILGFAEHKNFGLAHLPNRFIDELMLLQSLSDPETSFLLLPLAIDAGVIGQDDLVGACNTVGVDPENAVIAVIVTIRDVGGQPQVTVNLRAPVVFDSETRTGWQYVLPNARYQVRHILNLPAATASGAPAAPEAPAANVG